MKSFLFCFRWAIVLAALQGIIFASIGISEHRRNLRYNHKNTSIEYFGCLPLAHQRLSSEERLYAAYGYCRWAAKFKFVVWTNLPVFVIWGAVEELTSNTNADQFRLFYVINGLGIPAFWFCIGSLIDRRRRRKRAAVLSPPMERR
jgi:hypothetical protein